MSESSLSAQLHWIIPLGSGRRRELVARASLIIATLQAICGLGDTLLEKNLFGFFPLLSSLITYEHGSNEIQLALSDMLISSIPPYPSDVVSPPQPLQSLPISHGVYDQYKDMSEEFSSDEDNEDYYVDNAPPYC
ncbi:hypothetical protein FXO38_32220 [Capsicum annuum]|nr:hypothetical protein FXO38_32220 [Capsicum annuum]KAF3666979.1 hypothetical protein FXO37_10257 [Capsicum annuum]